MRAHNFTDLSGQRFGRLTVMALASTSPKTRWKCVCDCGVEATKQSQHLTSGLSRSCGCLRREIAAVNMRAKSTKHGLSVGVHARAYSSWHNMMRRCYVEGATRYHRYGGRGIQVDTSWHDPHQFLADMGDPPPGQTLERINNDGNYGPDNCCWATRLAQNNNRVTTRNLTHNGVSMSAAAWAREIGITKATMYQRLRSWTLEQALTTPSGGRQHAQKSAHVRVLQGV